jgi:hypothetical protein
MPKYISEEDFGERISFGFDKSEFGDVEVFGTIMEYKKARLSFWSNIDIGGSIAGPPLFIIIKYLLGHVIRIFIV